MRGKTIRFTRTNLDVYSLLEDIENTSITTQNEGQYAIIASNEGYIIPDMPYNVDYIWHYSGDSGIWDLTEYTFTNERDLIVTSNDLPSHTGDSWGFDYAYVVESV